jgi:hypothetical protein
MILSQQTASLILIFSLQCREESHPGNTHKHQTNILENRTKQKPQRGFFLIKREHKKTQVPLITLTVLESILFNAIQFIKNPNKILSSFFFFIIIN